MRGTARFNAAGIVILRKISCALRYVWQCVVIKVLMTVNALVVVSDSAYNAAITIVIICSKDLFFIRKDPMPL